MNGIVTNMHKDNHIYNELLNNFKFHKDNNAVLINMYTLLKESYDVAPSIEDNAKTLSNVSFTKNQLAKIIDISRFFPKHIEEYLLKEHAHYKYFHFTIKNRHFKIHVYEYNKKDAFNAEDIEYIKSWFTMISNYAPSNCSTNLNVHLFLTPITKYLPKEKNTMIEPKHVNSAYTYGCSQHNKIIIYRFEEWKKVLLHESFHTFNFDFHSNNFNDLRMTLKNIFNVHSDYEIYETYCETWATLWSCAYKSFYLTQITGKQMLFIPYMETLIAYEQQFATLQSNKIMANFDFNYKMLIQGNASNYRENTNVFCYYILKSLCLININAFLSVSSKCMNNPFNIVFDSHCEQSLIQFFKTHIDNDISKKINTYMEKYAKNSKYTTIGRMTLFG